MAEPWRVHGGYDTDEKSWKDGFVVDGKGATTDSSFQDSDVYSANNPGLSSWCCFNRG